ncbi:hypothetical protein SGI36_21705, partial [Providencia rettgeri]
QESTNFLPLTRKIDSEVSLKPILNNSKRNINDVIKMYYQIIETKENLDKLVIISKIIIENNTDIEFNNKINLLDPLKA